MQSVLALAQEECVQIGLRSKILLAPVIGSIFFCGFLAYSLNVSRRNALRLELMRDALFPELEAATSSVNLLEKVIEGLNQGVTTGEKDQITATEELAQHIRNNLDLIQKVDHDRGPEAGILKQEFDAYYKSASTLSLSMIGHPVPDLAAIKDMGDRLATFRSHVEQFQKDSHARFTQAVDETRDSSSRSTRIGLELSIIALAASLTAALLVANATTKNVHSVVQSLRDIAKGDGDLRKRIEVTSHDEIGELVRWFNTFIELLHGDIRRVVASVHQLSDMTASMATIVAQADRSLTQQQALAAQVTDEVNLMATRVDQMAKNATSASSAAQTADSAASEGLTYVAKVISQAKDLARHADGATEILQQLKSDSQKITEVVDVIQDVSNNTHMLALNASIEAAHAGEHGRGFAVVADEVSRMAGRTQESTIRITEIVDKLQQTTARVTEIIMLSQQETDSTLEQAKGSGDMLHRISERVGTINTMNTAIAQATDHQRLASQQIHQNMEELNRSSLQTVAEGTQLAEISRTIQTLSEDLRAIADHFIT